MSVSTQPQTFQPGIRTRDPAAAYWLHQATLRLRREICWLWRERSHASERAEQAEISSSQIDSALPPFSDRLSSSLDLTRYADQKQAFFERDETASWLSEQLAEPAPSLAHLSPPPPRGSFSWVARELALAPIDCFALALALVAVTDSASGPVFAACLNEPGRPHPTLALCQRLWDQAEDVLALTDPAHPLVRHGLLQPAPTTWDAPLSTPSLIARQLLHPEAVPTRALSLLTTATKSQRAPSARVSINRARLAGPARGLRFVPLLGARGAPLAAYAAELGHHVATVAASAREHVLPTLLTLAWLRGNDLYFDAAQLAAANVACSEHDSTAPTALPLPDLPLTIFVGIHERSALKRLPAAALPVIELAPLNYAERLALWQEKLPAAARTPELAAAVAECSRRFRYERGSIESICRELAALDRPLGPAELFAACRADLDLGELAQPVIPRFAARDLMLPPKQASQIEDVIHAMRQLTSVHYEWGTAQAWNESGITVLFAGPPGTGKTMGAEVIARALDLPMYRIDLSQVVNKYIGETEKNLRRLFDAADTSDVILFFDEADSLFGKRTEVKDAHDRYANLEVSYLLERMERFKGLAILATNRKKDLDEAFLRRLRYLVDFPLPGPDERQRIWAQCIPENVDASALDFVFLAQRIPLAGGHIRAIIFHACLACAQPGGIRALTMPAVLRAVRSEYEKLDRAFSLDQFRPWTAQLDAP